ncbi:hypothetical protein BCR44DRAFT_1118801 [Catenaria anguillulae PL171]|uniref:Uncharacterized protein n=1 Tax=Catenaria anguillulae PL171 TaxID=765915 RepID=A0A1Y2HNI2_9FUNG|nr:hypothetical protein BCR44DRAFT_1118801 [Catenaria anguillulae PL171]
MQQSPIPKACRDPTALKKHARAQLAYLPFRRTLIQKRPPTSPRLRDRPCSTQSTHILTTSLPPIHKHALPHRRHQPDPNPCLTRRAHARRPQTPGALCAINHVPALPHVRNGRRGCRTVHARRTQQL